MRQRRFYRLLVRKLLSYGVAFGSVWMTAVLISIAPASAQSSNDTSASEPSALTSLENVDYWTNLCRLQADAGAYPEALKSCEQAIALSPENANIWAQHSGLLVQTEAFPEAIASADQALSFDPSNSLAIAYQCVAYSALGETETALDKCNDALRVNGSWGTENPALAWRYRGTLLADAQQYEMALVAFERSLLLEPEDSLTLTQKCGVYVTMHKSHQALETCQTALAVNQHWGNNNSQSGPALAWTYQGQAYSQLGRYDNAIAAYDQSIALNPNNALTWSAQGQVLDQLKRDAEALVSFEQAIALQPDSSLALLGQCTLLNRLANDELANYETALASCDAALEGDGDWGANTLADAWNQRSIALAGTGQYEEALASINRAVGIDPQYVAAHNHRSTILWYLGRYPQALAANQQALTIDDSYAPTWFTRGVIFRALENYEQALIAYNRGLALDPLNAWAWTNRSVILWQMEDYEEALVSAERAIALNPQSTAAFYNQGTAMSALGLYGGAVIAYNKVLDLDANHANALTGRGIARMQLKDYEAATADLQAALALSPDNVLAQETLSALAVEQSP